MAVGLTAFVICDSGCNQLYICYKFLCEGHALDRGDRIFHWFTWAEYLDVFLGGGFRHFLCSSLFGEDSQFDSYFSDGLKPPTSFVFDINFLGSFSIIRSSKVQQLTSQVLS